LREHREKETTMRRATLLLLATITAVLVATGVALAATLVGTDGNDLINGTSGSDTLNVAKNGTKGTAGADALYGKGGNDILYGGPATTTGRPPSDTIRTVIRYPRG
jgi:Ca2+-binding RTX toxin-like protein